MHAVVVGVSAGRDGGAFDTAAQKTSSDGMSVVNIMSLQLIVCFPAICCTRSCVVSFS